MHTHSFHALLFCIGEFKLTCYDVTTKGKIGRSFVLQAQEISCIHSQPLGQVR